MRDDKRLTNKRPTVARQCYRPDVTGSTYLGTVTSVDMLYEQHVITSQPPRIRRSCIPDLKTFELGMSPLRMHARGVSQPPGQLFDKKTNQE